MHSDNDHTIRGRLGTALAATVLLAVAVVALVERAARRPGTAADERGFTDGVVAPVAYASPTPVEHDDEQAAWSPRPLADAVAVNGAAAPPVWEPTHGNSLAQTGRFGEWDVDDIDAAVMPEPAAAVSPNGSATVRPASLRRFATWGSAVALLGVALVGGVAVNGATADDALDPLAQSAPATETPVDATTLAVEPAPVDPPAAAEAPPVLPVADEPAVTEPAPVVTPPVIAPDAGVLPPDEDEPCDPDGVVVDEDELGEHESCQPADDATGAGAAGSDQAPVDAGQPAADATSSSDAAVAAPVEAAAAPAEPVVDGDDEPLRGAVAELPIYDLDVASDSGAGSAASGTHRSQKAGKANVSGAALKANAPGLDGAAASRTPLEAPPAIAILSSPLMPTPEQIRLYVRAEKTKPLPRLKVIDHELAGRFAAAGRRYRVGWTLLAALAREESNFGTKKGHGLLGGRLSDSDFTRYALHAGRVAPIARTDPGDALAAVADYLKVHGASREALAPGKSTAALTAYLGSRDAAERVTASAAFLGAVGTHGMQHGLAASSKRLRLRVMKDTRVEIYAGGRRDVKQGRVDTRVLLVAEYLANSFGQVRLSSLVTGHRLFSSAGTVSAHVYGRAVDIAEVGHVPVYGNQEPGSVTERAVKLLLMLPGKAQPRQVISLLDLDGPTGNRGSFSLADHEDHIQVGF